MTRSFRRLTPALAGCLLAAAGVLAGCGSSAASSDAGSATEPDFGQCTVTSEPGSIDLDTQSPDVLTVATVLPNPGWWNGTSPETTDSGFEYCMAADIANRAGLTSVVLKNLSWDQYISGTATGYDIGVASTMITEEREQIFDFSDPYFASDLGVAVQEGSGVTAENLTEKTIGIMAGNVGAQYVTEELRPDVAPRTFQNMQDMFVALQAGQVDAVVTDTSQVLAGVKPSNGALVVAGRLAIDQHYGIVMPNGSPNVTAVNEALAAAKSDGTLERYTTDYLVPEFGVDPATIPIWND